MLAVETLKQTLNVFQTFQMITKILNSLGLLPTAKKRVRFRIQCVPLRGHQEGLIKPLGETKAEIRTLGARRTG